MPTDDERPADAGERMPTREAEMIARIRATARRIDERVKKALQDTDISHTPLDQTDLAGTPLPPT
jgi:hypothetical protein